MSLKFMTEQSLFPRIACTGNGATFCGLPCEDQQEEGGQGWIDSVSDSTATASLISLQAFKDNAKSFPSILPYSG